MAGIDSYTKLMLHFDGTDGATSISDSSAYNKAIVANGNAHIESDQSKFGGTSAYFDGSGDYIKSESSSDFAFGTGDFTVDFWVYLINGGHGSSWSRIFETASYPTSGGINISTYGSENPARLSIQLSDGTQLLNSDSSVSNTTWHHVAITRASGTLRLFIDGTVQTSTPSSLNSFSAQNLSVGGNLSGGESFYGYIDEFRVSKGIARWVASFTPESSAYTLDSSYNTVSESEIEVSIPLIESESSKELALSVSIPSLEIIPGDKLFITVDKPTSYSYSFSSNATSEISVSSPTLEIDIGKTRGESNLEALKAKISASSIYTLGFFSGTLKTPTSTFVSAVTSGNLVETISKPKASIRSTYTTGGCAVVGVLPEFEIVSNSTLGFSRFNVPDIDIALSSNYTRGSFSLTAPNPVIKYSLLFGTKGGIVRSVSKPGISISGWTNTSGSISSSIPHATIDFVQLASGEWPCIVMNTDVFTLSEYTNYHFIGFAKLGNKYLAAHKDGNIYLLGGDTDNGYDIDSLFETGMDDLGTIKSKRIAGISIGLRSDGETQYRMHRFDDYGGYISVSSSEEETLETRKPPVERTSLSRVYGVEFSNVDGCDFSVDSIELDLTLSTRRGNGS